MKQEMKASEVAYRAAGVMARQGHCKNTIRDWQGKVCYLGALREVSSNDAFFMNELEMKVYWTSRSLLRERGDNTDPVRYNNRPSVTGEDVILLLKETGRRLEEEGK